MATTFKTFLNNDVISSRTLLNEAIPVTGTILSGTYGTYGSETNIKNYSHGMFQTVFDYPYLSSSANHIFDITCGYHATSTLSSSESPSQRAKKINIYNQMAQVLMGYDTSGDIRPFDEDGDLTGGTKLKECIFLNFARLLTKDEIKKGSFTLELGTKATYATPMTERIKLTDIGAANEYRINSPAGEYGILIADTTKQGGAGGDVDRLTNDTGTLAAGQKAGLIFYQAGIVVLTSSIFQSTDDGGILLANQASAINCIDTTGLLADRYNDASFTISISTAAGGLGGTAVTILLDASQSTSGTGGANQIMIGTDDGITDAARAALIIKAINAVTDSKINYATSGNGEAADDLGITATEGSSNTQITLTMDTVGVAGNITSAIATVSGVNIIDVTAFTAGGGGANTSIMTAAGSNNEIDQIMVSSSIQSVADAFRRRVYNISFNNTTELNSTIYFCRANNNDFNYSSNPTYLSSSKVVVKQTASDEPLSYMTTIGLYSSDNELLAVAKLSEPLKKTPSNEFTLRVRLDY